MDKTATATETAALVRGMDALYRAAVLEVMMHRYRWTAEAADRVAGEVADAVRRRAGRAQAVEPAPRRSAA